MTDATDVPDLAYDSGATLETRRAVISLFYGRRSDWEGMKQLLFHASAISISGIACWHSRNSKWCIRILGLGIHSFTMSFLFHALHETVHGTAFRYRSLNWMVRNICGVLTLRPPAQYYYYHWAHHRHTGDPEKDPELFNTMIDIQILDFRSYLMYLSGAAFWIDRISTILRHALGCFQVEAHEYFVESEESRKLCTREARMYTVIYAVVTWLARDSRLRGLIVNAWVAPSLIGQIHLRYYLLAEHRGCLQSGGIEDNTRTTSTIWLSQRLAWNMPFHMEHHAWPGVPFHLLEEASQFGRLVVSRCVPSGEEGYFRINYHLATELSKKSSGKTVGKRNK